MSSRFVTTSWTQVLAARESPSSESRQALEGLCEAYWYPSTPSFAGKVMPPEESRDLTQAYFAQLLEKGYLEDFDPSLGRFRAFLKASVKNFLSKERDKTRAWKRRGRAQFVSLSADEVEGRYRYEPVDRLTPEEIFERRWALTLIERTLSMLRGSSKTRAGRKSSRSSRGISPETRSRSRTVRWRKSSAAPNRQLGRRCTACGRDSGSS
jgi:RNA polymerase sigma-70 factor (ECF subfamily)